VPWPAIPTRRPLEPVTAIVCPSWYTRYMSTKEQRAKFRAILAESPSAALDVLSSAYKSGGDIPWHRASMEDRAAAGVVEEILLQRRYLIHEHGATLHRPTCRTRTCDHCGNDYTARRTDSRYCSGRCRVAALRARRQGQP
jgi:hypothetical protein